MEEKITNQGFAIETLTTLSQHDPFVSIYLKGLSHPDLMFSQIHGEINMSLIELKKQLVHIYDLWRGETRTKTIEVLGLLTLVSEFAGSDSALTFKDSKSYAPNFKRNKKLKDESLNLYNVEWLLEETIEVLEEVRICRENDIFRKGTSEDVVITIFSIFTELKDMLFLFPEYDMSKVLETIDVDLKDIQQYEYDMRFISDFIKTNPMKIVSELLLIDIFIFDYVKSSGRKDFCFSNVLEARRLMISRFDQEIVSEL